MSGVTDRLFCSQLKNCLSRLNSFFVLICGFRRGIKPCYLLPFHCMLFCKTTILADLIVSLLRFREDVFLLLVRQHSSLASITDTGPVTNDVPKRAYFRGRRVGQPLSGVWVVGGPPPPPPEDDIVDRTSLQQIVLTLHLTQCSCFSVMICRNRNRRSATLQSHRRSCKALFIHCSSHVHTQASYTHT